MSLKKLNNILPYTLDIFMVVITYRYTASVLSNLTHYVILTDVTSYVKTNIH